MQPHLERLILKTHEASKLSHNVEVSKPDLDEYLSGAIADGEPPFDNDVVLAIEVVRGLKKRKIWITSSSVGAAFKRIGLMVNTAVNYDRSVIFKPRSDNRFVVLFMQTFIQRYPSGLCSQTKRLATTFPWFVRNRAEYMSPDRKIDYKRVKAILEDRYTLEVPIDQVKKPWPW